MKYEPETRFKISEDGRLVYNLRNEPIGRYKQTPSVRNDIAVAVEARHLPKEIQSEIAQAICDALNAKYPVGKKQITSEKGR